MKTEIKTFIFNAKAKCNTWKLHAKSKGKDMVSFFEKHPGFVIFVTPIVLGILTKGTRTIVRGRRLKRETFNKERYIYDRSLGHYWKLNRKLSSNEYKKIAVRKQNGEKLVNILDDMRVI